MFSETALSQQTSPTPLSHWRFVLILARNPDANLDKRSPGFTWDEPPWSFPAY